MNENLTTDIPCNFQERQWMQAAKAWRCILDLPENQMLAAALTALIEQQVKITIVAPSGLQCEIDPAFIVNVRNRKRQFYLVVETCFEGQKVLGPKLTAMIGERVRVTIEPIASNKAGGQAPADGKIGKAETQALHSTFFKNPRFHKFMEIRTSRIINTPEACKEAYKAHHQVESCRDIDKAAFLATLGDFNKWLNGGA